MAVKRKSPDHEEERCTKQTKLNFGRSMTPKNGNAGKPRSANKAGPQKLSSKDDITSKPPPKAKEGFTLLEETGDIFDAPDDTVIIHACNCVGSWGAGIAAAFKQKYSQAFKTYQAHCKETPNEDLIRTALLIPPKDGSPKHYVGCLFTSKIYGRRKDVPQEILDATAPAMQDLMRQMEEVGMDIKEIRICQINSGLFAVPWEHTRAVLESLEVGNMEIPKEITVYSLPKK